MLAKPCQTSLTCFGVAKDLHAIEIVIDTLLML